MLFTMMCDVLLFVFFVCFPNWPKSAQIGPEVFQILQNGHKWFSNWYKHRSHLLLMLLDSIYCCCLFTAICYCCYFCYLLLFITTVLSFAVIYLFTANKSAMFTGSAESIGRGVCACNSQGVCEIFAAFGASSAVKIITSEPCTTQ